MEGGLPERRYGIGMGVDLSVRALIGYKTYKKTVV